MNNEKFSQELRKQLKSPNKSKKTKPYGIRLSTDDMETLKKHGLTPSKLIRLAINALKEGKIE